MRTAIALTVLLAAALCTLSSAQTLGYSLYNADNCGGTVVSTATYTNATSTNGVYTSPCVFFVLASQGAQSFQVTCSTNNSSIVFFTDPGCTSAGLTATGGGSGACISVAPYTGSVDVTCGASNNDGSSGGSSGGGGGGGNRNSAAESGVGTAAVAVLVAAATAAAAAGL